MAANQGAYPVDTTTDIGYTRLLLQDNVGTDIQGAEPDQTATYMWIGDDEIQAFLDHGMTPAKIAIRILRMVAMTPAMQLKKWSSADLSVDGAAITRALREMIADIESEDSAADDAAASEYINIVPVGPAMAQPAFFPHVVPTYNGEELDPTLPVLL